MKIHIDFETRSKADIWDVGAWNYSKHPSTEVLCIAWAIDDGEVQLTPYESIWESPIKELVEDATLYAHNVFFEKAIWYNILVPRFNYPVPPLDQWRCTMSVVASHSLPLSLAKAAEAAGICETKDAYGKQVMQKLSRARIPTKNNPNEWNGTPEEFNALYEYCKQDVRTERELHRKYGELGGKELELWILDQRMNWGGITVDLDFVRAAIRMGEVDSIEQLKELKNITNSYLDNVSQIKKVLHWVQSQGVDIKDMRKETIHDYLKTQVLPDNVRRALQLRLSLSKTSTAKYDKFISSTDDTDGRLRDTLVYHGANTGRWTGKQVQLHNLPRGSIQDTNACVSAISSGNIGEVQLVFGDVQEALSSCIRGALIPTPGYKLYVADYKSIEARVLAWLSGDDETCDKYYKGADLYVDMAKEIYRQETITKPERTVGKTAVLGCGYGMGATRFAEMCKQNFIPMDEDSAERVVRTYRRFYSLVPCLWRRIEEAVIQVRLKGKPLHLSSKGVTIRQEDLGLSIELPSGRKLWYNEPSIKNQKFHYYCTNGVTKQWEEVATWGGTLVENIVQAIARDIMANGMMTVAISGRYNMLLTIHDEIVAESYRPNSSVKDFVELITDLPPWAKGCPIEAEGWSGERYRK